MDIEVVKRIRLFVFKTFCNDSKMILIIFAFRFKRKMYKSSIKIRVRYAETDRMGYVYYGNYATYFEVARVEALRGLGISYRILEDAGILLPVLDYSVRYRRPAYYDDELEIRTVITEFPQARIHFEYEVVNAEGTVITTASTTLVFIDKATGKPRPAPLEVQAAIQPYFQD
ncbi:MAG: hypothetical protein RL021_1194 [Bacteroidota bacterium]|jgi:acyl-CoA thioester hydrolase